MPVHILPALDTIFALSPVAPLPAAIVVTRLETKVASKECALCWSGPVSAAAVVRERAAVFESARPICSRCLVTLEMLAVQFGADLRLSVETSA